MEDLGKLAYEAYFKSCGGKSVRGDTLPSWEDQSEEIRAHWDAVGQMFARYFTTGSAA